jgi:hypothetical protein
MKNCVVKVENGNYAVSFPYDPATVEMIKRYIPNTGRSWDGIGKRWIIAGQYRREAENALGMTLPAITAVKITPVVKLLTVHYIGQCKERAAGDVSAMALLETGVWGAVFSESVLRAWFDDNTSANTPTGATLYAVLGAHQTDDLNAVKSAYRRMARQWHPDVCRESNANEMFLRIREAYDILSNSRGRSRYDAGLILAASVDDNRSGRVETSGMYRSPLRCGYILCEGVDNLGRMNVSNIIAWDDITRADGRAMVASWAPGGKSPIIAWS